jgi:hypothetical protein
LAHAFLWEYSYKRLELVQLLDQLGVLLTWSQSQEMAEVAPVGPRVAGWEQRQVALTCGFRF